MRLTVIGCSGSGPSPDSPASCYLLEAEGFRLVIDLGSGSLGPLQRYVAVHQVDALVLSHLHADHFIDMCSLWVARNWSSEGVLPRLPVYGPAEAARRVSMANDDPDVSGVYEFVALAPGSRPIGPFTVTAGHVAHPVETFAYRFEHGGRTLAYSGDTGPCPALAGLAASADLLLCEAGFPELPGLPPDLHLCGSQAGQHAAAAGARRLLLTHLAPGEDPAPNLAGAQDAFPGPVTLAAPGLTVDL